MTGSHPHDGLVLRLLLMEAAGSLGQWRLRHVLGIGVGGLLLLAYGLADLLLWVAHHAALLQQNRLWTIGLPLVALGLGGFVGMALMRLCSRRAEAGFLRVLPLSDTERRRMAAITALALAAPVALVTGLLLAILALAAGEPIWASSASATFAALLGIIVGLRLGRPMRHQIIRRRSLSVFLAPIAALDRYGTAWLGNWAWGLTGSRLRLGLSHLAWSFPMGLILALTMATSLHSHAAEPGVTMALVAALLSFVLTLRYRPLGSAALRSLPIGFGHAWLRLARLPFLLSAALFALVSAIAIAAEPRAWVVPLQQGGALVALEAIYAVFAAYFLYAPAVAALACAATLGYAAYASLQYGNTVYLMAAIVVGWLWFRARRRFRHG